MKPDFGTKKTGKKSSHKCKEISVTVYLELVNQFFDFGTPNFRNLDKKIRFNIFEEVANSKLEGLIFTMVWAFNEAEDEAYIDEIIAIFEKKNPKVCFVELVCNLEERLRRNKHENRLHHKASKRDVEASEKRLLYHDGKYRMNSQEGDLQDKSMFKVHNTNLTATEAAEKIITFYELTTTFPNPINELSN